MGKTKVSVRKLIFASKAETGFTELCHGLPEKRSFLELLSRRLGICFFGLGSPIKIHVLFPFPLLKPPQQSSGFLN
ncbi:MAG: hypothetical protein ACOZFS_14650 [Thermodesulfobacteriota bacterium]